MIMAPKGTAPAIIARLNALANTVLADAEAKARLEGAGLSPIGGTPERAGMWLAEELRRHAEIVRLSGARID